MTNEVPEGLSTVVCEVLAVFEEDLRGVRFGDLDAERLEEATARVRATQAEVDEARDLLDAALRVHEEEVARLGALADKALAYARIYAESDPALRDRLDAVAGADKPPKKRKRGKKRAPAEVTELPFAATGS